MDAGVVEVKESLEAAPPRFVIDGMVAGLPAPLVALLAEHDAAGNSLLVAAIAARFALLRGPGMGTGVDDPLFRAACAWWRRLSRRQQRATEDFAEALAAGLLADATQARDAGERLADADLELLALRRDDLASLCGFMFVAGEGAGRDAGRDAREVQMRLDVALDDIYAANKGATFTSAWLATVAAYRGGWWAVAPGAEPPALAADAYCNVDEDDDGDGYDEWDDGDEDDEGEGDADWEDEGVEDWDEE